MPRNTVLYYVIYCCVAEVTMLGSLAAWTAKTRYTPSEKV
jgi:hypothetical protein